MKMAQGRDQIMTDDIHLRNLRGGEVHDCTLLLPIAMGDVSEYKVCGELRPRRFDMGLQWFMVTDSGTIIQLTQREPNVSLHQHL
jgi:hypothetical protein